MNEPVDLFLDGVRREIHSLGQLLDAKRVVVPQEGQRLLIDSLTRINGWISGAFSAERRARARASEGDRIALALRYRDLVAELQSNFLKYLSETDQAYCPPELGLAVDRMARDVSARTAVILHPTPTAIPEIRGISNLEEHYLDVLGRYAPRRAKPSAQQPDDFIFISYPQVMASSPVMHTIVLSHELAHYQDWISGISASLGPVMALTAADFNHLIEELQNRPIILDERQSLPPTTYGEQLSRETIEAAVAERWSELRDSWLGEIVCDLIAARQFGPAFFFALAQWSLAVQVIDVQSDSHPRSRLRLDLVARELRSMGYTRYRTGPLGVAKAQFSTWLGLFGRARVMGELIHSKAEDYVRANVGQIRRAVREATRDSACEPRSLRKELNYLVDLLRHGVPPGELPDFQRRVTRPASLAAILNAYFIFEASSLGYLYGLVGARTEQDRVEARAKLEQLILKAIESTEIRDLWERANSR